MAKSTTPQVKIVNCETGEEIIRDANADELAQMQLDAANAAKEKAEDMEKSKAEDMEMKEKSMDEMTKAVKAGDMYKDGMDEKTIKDTYDKMIKAKDEDDDKKSDAMDSAIKALTKQVATLQSTAMDGESMMKAFGQTQELKQQVSAIIGAIPSDHVDQHAVAKYAVDKIGIACDSGAELATLRGYLAGRKAPTFTVDHGIAKDNADSAKSETLDKLGL